MEDNKAPAGPTGSASGATEKDDGVLDTPATRAKVQELLNEKKKVLSENESLKAKLQEEATEKLLIQGKYKEHAETLAKQLADEKARSQKTHKFYSEKVLKEQFYAEAAKAGCIAPEDAFKIANLNGIEIGEDFTLDPTGLKSALEDLKKEKPYMFPKTASAPKDVPPSNRINKTPGTPQTREELYAELKKLL